jgi:N6-adenosine-specific RNA methylase IME4
LPRSSQPRSDRSSLRDLLCGLRWSYRNESSRSAAVNHYETMALDQICAMPKAELVDKKAHLHLWATTPLLPDALAIIRAWRFRYKSGIVWLKDKLGMGNYWRISHEVLLQGVCGRLRFRDRKMCSWLN